MRMFPPVAQAAQPALVDNMFAPEIVVGGISGLAILNGIVTVTLENGRCDHSVPQPVLERVVVGRVAMSVPAAQSLLSCLYDFLGQHGINPLAAQGDATCQ